MNNEQLTQLIWQIVVEGDTEAMKFLADCVSICADLALLRNSNLEYENDYWDIRDSIDQAVDSLIEPIEKYGITESEWLNELQS